MRLMKISGSLVLMGIHDKNRALYMVDTIVTHTAKNHPAESNTL